MSDVDSIPLRTTSNGVLLPVKVQPRASQNALAGVHAGRLKVSVTQVPEKGKANAAVIDILCRALKLKNAQVTLIAGVSNSRKSFAIADISVSELRARLARTLPPAK